MKKFVVNLPSRQDRKEQFIKAHDWLEDYEFIEAVDGFTISHADMIRNEFATRSEWRDPHSGRRITKGEVGCFISHYKLWQQCIQLNETILILEDDCILDEDLYDEEMYAEITSKEDVNMLYLGYNELETSETTMHGDKRIIVVGQPYNTHAYVLTPDMAATLIDFGFHSMMIPVDNCFCEVSSGPIELHAMKVHHAKQMTREESASNVEPRGDFDYFIDFNVHVLTVGSNSRKCVKLNDSSRLLGFDVLNLGTNVDWQGSDMTGPGGGQKINLVKDYIAAIPERDVVLFTDAYDVFYTFDLETIVRRYLDMQLSVIFSAEKELWPDEKMREKHPLSVTDYRYMNSGCYIGEVSTLRNLFSLDIANGYDDQLYCQENWLNNQKRLSLTLDYEGYIFQSHEPALKMKDGLLYNSKTFCYPCVYHGNGGDEAKVVFNKYYDQLHNGAEATELSNPVYLKDVGKILHLEKDMLIVDFMTQSQCERLIEIGDAHAGWAPMEGDKFPAYEIRIKELGNDLWTELAQHWKEYIHPVIENYWKPIEMYGMRDAFIMRYSVDTQRSLPLHHDASLVTGSVKLNDNYKGASLEYPRQNINNDDVPVGKMILFPGQVTHGHQCTTIEEGVKYSYTMWTSRYPGDEN